MIITISGKAGSGKSTVARILAKKLGFKHYSMGDLRKRMALDKGMTLAELNLLGESDSFTDLEVDEYQKRLGKKEDDFVVDGRLSFHFIPKSYKVFLTASLDARAERVFLDERAVEKFRDFKDARKALIAREKSDQKRYRKYYRLNHMEEKHYDLVLDTTHLAAGKVAEIILKGLK